MVMIAKVPTADGKLFAKGFLWQWFAVFPRRAGNGLRRVSYGDDSPCSHGGQETVRKGFPMAMIHNALMPGWKLVAKSFLWWWLPKFPRQMGDYSRKVSYGN